MKRIIVWVDSKDEKVERDLNKLKQLLNLMDLNYTIVEVCEIYEGDTH